MNENATGNAQRRREGSPVFLRFLPFLSWFKGYNGNTLKADAVSGLTVALVLIPQSMAYAQLAGLPSYYGLYAAFIPPMVASLFGSSRQLATGPVAVVSLMTSASLEPLASAGSEGYVAYAILLALIVGVFQLSLGVLKLGVVVNFLSHPVVNGFTNAAAIIIATSQLSKMFGVYVDNSPHHYETIWKVIQAAIHYTHWPTLLLGALAFGIMYGLKRTMPKIPNVLVAVAVTTLISWSIGFEHNARVDLSVFQSADIQDDLRDYNQVLTSLQELADQRTKMTALLEEVRQTEEALAVLDAEHNLQKVNIRLNQVKREALEKREHLRDLLFRNVAPDEAETPVLALRDAGDREGRIWRVKVTNRPFDMDNLLIMGGGAVVGVVPKGLPAFEIPHLDLKIFLHLLPYAVIISLLGFMEAISIAKAIAARTGQRLDPNQELIGQGLANILGSMGHSYPTSGSFSRSAVNLQAGAVTGLSSVFTSGAVVIMLLFLTPLLYHLPQSVLAAVIIMAVIGLVNVSGFLHAWRAQPYDGIISVISFVATLAFAPHLDKGIMIGVALSLAVFLYKAMRPTAPSLSRTPDDALRDAVEHGLARCKYIDLIRFDGPLFFANASFLEDSINLRLEQHPELRQIIIACNGINDMDASGEEMLALVIDRVRSAGIRLSFSGINESVMAVLKRTHLYEKVRDDVFPTMERAICEVHAEAHRDGNEGQCPLTTACFHAEVHERPACRTASP